MAVAFFRNKEKLKKVFSIGCKKLEMLNCDDVGIFHFVLIKTDVRECADYVALIVFLIEDKVIIERLGVS